MEPECRDDDGAGEFKLELDVAEEPAEYQRKIPSGFSGEFPAVHLSRASYEAKFQDIDP